MGLSPLGVKQLALLLIVMYCIGKDSLAGAIVATVSLYLLFVVVK